MTNDEIEQRLELLKEISPWPWKTDPIGYECYVWSKEQNMVADTVIRMRGVGSRQPISKNYEFIVTAPEFEAKLIDEVKRLRAKIDGLGAKVHQATITFEQLSNSQDKHAGIMARDTLLLFKAIDKATSPKDGKDVPER